MLTDIQFPISGEYRSGTEWEPIVFHLDALLESKNMDLLLGYFSSSAISVLSLGFATFLCRGGCVRLVANHILSAKDKSAILKGQNSNEVLFDFKIDDIQRFKDSLDDYGIHFFECLAWLIASKRIEIIAIKPKSDKGIAHYKSGIYSNDTNQVRFKSSCNFTASGLLENLEELSIRCSWKSKEEQEAISEYQDYFNDIFFKKADFVQYVAIEDVEIAILKEFGSKDIKELLEQEHLLLKKRNIQNTNQKLSEALERAKTAIENYLKQPRFPFPEGPRAYQMDAYQKWVANDFHGIFAMATGTGKTITSLNCVLLESIKNEDKTYKAIILVPTISLVEQWEKEVKAFNFTGIFKVSSKTAWEKELSSIMTFLRYGGKQSFVVICTYASFYREKFQFYLKKMPDDTILIADEGHNIASAKVLEVLQNVDLKKRIGLSATPKRNYDEIGTAAMEAFFKDAEPYVYSFSMERAINEGVLCKYKYYPHLVTLTALELEQYIIISKKLMRLFDFKKGQFKENDAVEKLLLARKRIVQKAANKLDKTKEILRQQLAEKGHLKYTFIYVPEGFSKAEAEEWVENEEDARLINQYTQLISEISPKIIVNQFTGETKNRELIFQKFASGDIQVLASMKCLDEGIDIPRAELAIFCSSTGNPRQFIQRRGRVLRKHPDKHQAVVHDLIVAPNFEGVDLDESTFNMERNLVRKELERVAYFAFLSENRYYTLENLEDICEHYNLNLHTIHQNLISS
jgi:superfamily II DNA or RNA helicase